MSEKETTDGVSRRDFMKSSVAAASAAAYVATGNYGYAASTDRIRVGLIGCGGRGTGAAIDAANAAPGVEIVAMGDVFQNRLDGSRNQLKGQLGDKYKVTDANAFSGFDNYKGVINNSDVNYVILATPPGFRPLHLDSAIRAGKHVFMEKPVAVDPTGVRAVIAASDLANQKKLGIVTGTQRRHQNSYIETVKRIKDGAIGEITGGQVYWNQGGLWAHQKGQNESDTEWQIRNWLYFAWLSGDHIVEQHVHNIDIMQWVLGRPESAVGMGGREVRTAPVYGHIFDHFTVDYVYPNDVHVMSMCRQIDGTASKVSEHFNGTKGHANPGGWIRAAENWRYQGPNPNPYVKEHTDNIAAIRAGKPLNEGHRIAESTLIAIMGRESAYTGKEISWDQIMGSKQDLMANESGLKMGELPVPPVPTPGKTALERSDYNRA